MSFKAPLIDAETLAVISEDDVVEAWVSIGSDETRTLTANPTVVTKIANAIKVKLSETDTASRDGIERVHIKVKLSSLEYATITPKDGGVLKFYTTPLTLNK